MAWNIYFHSSRIININQHEKIIYSCGPIYKHGLTLIPVWISNHIHYKVWDEITSAFLYFNGCTVEV